MTTTVVSVVEATTVVTDASGVQTVISVAGQPGQRGPAGQGATAVYPITIASATWTVTHNLGRYPQVELIDSTGAVFDGDVEFPDLNTAVVTLAAPATGSVLIS